MLAALSLLALLGLARGLDNNTTRTPPMGWLQWGKFRCITNCSLDPENCISERLVKAQVDAMVAGGYVAAGYVYVSSPLLRTRPTPSPPTPPHPPHPLPALRAAAPCLPLQLSPCPHPLAPSCPGERGRLLGAERAGRNRRRRRRPCTIPVRHPGPRRVRPQQGHAPRLVFRHGHRHLRRLPRAELHFCRRPLRPGPAGRKPHDHRWNLQPRRAVFYASSKIRRRFIEAFDVACRWSRSSAGAWTA